MQGGHSAEILRVLAEALREWLATPATSALCAARAFCIHELAPSQLLPGLDRAAKKSPTVEVRRFQELGVAYFLYEPDGAWVLREDPVDLDQLATRHLDSP
jgi:hypothetical protein